MPTVIMMVFQQTCWTFLACILKMIIDADTAFVDGHRPVGNVAILEQLVKEGAALCYNHIVRDCFFNQGGQLIAVQVLVL